MRFGFELRMAWREALGSRRSLLLLVGAVAVGVGALVAVRSFAEATLRAARAEARSLLGADLMAWSARPFTPAAEARFAELLSEAGETRLARVTGFGAMAASESGGARLVQVTALEAGYPFYGRVESEPADAWERLQDSQGVLVDPALLPALHVAVGQSLTLGEARFTIAGVVRRFPGDVGIRSAFGPRVFIARRYVEATRLTGAGARIRHEAYVRLARSLSPELLRRHRGPLAAEQLSLRTLDEDQARLGEGLQQLARFLSLIALVAVLLGGVAVASAIHVLVRRKTETIAVLRSLGAGGGRVTRLYLVQALGVGLCGGVAGALLGAGLASVLPRLLGDLLPVSVEVGVSVPALFQGLALGTGAATLFALPSLLQVRHVSPLVALRRDYERQPTRRDVWDLAALALLPAGVALLSVSQAGSWPLGLAYALGLGATLAILAAVALGLRRLLRRRVSGVVSFAWRQGLASLYRPQNQTLAVALALGAGSFLLGTLLVVERNLLRDLRGASDPRRPNLALFDIQPDQIDAVLGLVAESGGELRGRAPIVPMRLASVKGRRTAEALGRMGPDGRPDPKAWALRREYRSSYRDTLQSSERVVAGAAWSPGAALGLAPEASVPVSLEAGLAEELGVGVGDELVWDVQGVPVKSRVASLRRVVWARFEPNFFALFPEGPLAAAPQSHVILLRLDDVGRRAELERRVVRGHANVSSLDLGDVQRALDAVLARVTWGVRFMALFSIGVGACVLAGSLLASRRERLREAVLLKMLGATRRQIARIALAEHACLGALSALSGSLLALLAGFAIVRFAFETAFDPPLLALTGFGSGVAALVVVLGALESRAVFKKTSLELLRAD